jgi:ATP-dependent DNA helicase RecQ
MPRIALTATADALTRADIVERLQATGAPVPRLRPAEHPLHHRREEGSHTQLLRFIEREHEGDRGGITSRASGE